MPRLRMSRHTLAILSAVVTAALVAGLVLILAGPATAKEFATLHPLAGAVEVKKADGPGFAPGTEGQTLRQGDTVRTGPDGRAEIGYFDGSATRLDFDTTYELVELASLPEVPDSKVIDGKQTAGRTFNRVVALTDSESRFETETPNALASVRGTMYVWWNRTDGTEECWVLEGELLVTVGDLEILVGAGEGIRVSGDEVEGPFPLTEVQLEDAFVVFNRCELDGEEGACPGEIEPRVERRQDHREPDPAPLPPSSTDGTDDAVVLDDVGGGGDGGDGRGGSTPIGRPGPGPGPGPGNERADPIDRRPVRFVLSWSEGPEDLDLHVLTPDEEDADGGEVWSANPCLSGPGGCWATASEDSQTYGDESVTLRPIDDEWVNGVYRIWVENISCEEDWSGSDAVLTVLKGDEAADIPLQGQLWGPGRSEEVRAQTWNVGVSVVTRDGFPNTVTSDPALVGEPRCGHVDLQSTKRPRGPNGPDSHTISIDPPTDEPVAGEPPTEEPPAEQPAPPPQPEPEPGSEPEPSPEVASDPTDPDSAIEEAACSGAEAWCAGYS
jgi:hypothetical protein